MDQRLGLYVHIPFCAALCHYCDFAKTARFDDDLIDRYVAALERHLAAWLEAPALQGRKFSSVFFGGGTPGLLTSEYERLMGLIRARLAAGAEVSLEANPANVTSEALSIWRDQGFNRPSMGVQTFDQHGLAFLTRDHDRAQAETAIELALAAFGNVNIDLIYSWPGQSEASWRADLDRAVALGVPHLSLYNLTYETRTPIGRRRHRGVLAPLSDEAQADRYELARGVLARSQYEHDEVSNWARPGYGCLHNWIYWSGDSYLGLGAGAHSYLDNQNGVGLRFAYTPVTTTFAKAPSPEPGPLAEMARSAGAQIDERDGEDWLLEMIGTSLRTRAGAPIGAIEQRLGRQFSPRPQVALALAQGLMSRTPQDRLVLSEAEWFREAGWSVEVAMSFR